MSHHHNRSEYNAQSISLVCICCSWAPLLCVFFLVKHSNRHYHASIIVTAIFAFFITCICCCMCSTCTYLEVSNFAKKNKIHPPQSYSKAHKNEQLQVHENTNIQQFNVVEIKIQEAT